MTQLCVIELAHLSIEGRQAELRWMHAGDWTVAELRRRRQTRMGTIAVNGGVSIALLAPDSIGDP
jgi:hypothetical protein